MSLYAISDFHLSFFKDKPMDIFGDNWCNHSEKIKNNWNNIVNDNDTVLVCGDISWAQTMEEFQPDLEYIKALKGNKIFIMGNHDYWWGSTQKLNDISDKMTFLKANMCNYENIAICGTRGWLCPNDTYYTQHDEKIYKRECNRLKIALDMAEQKGYNDIYVMLHYPPVNDKGEYSVFQELIEQYNVKKVIYGHLHGAGSFKTGIQGKIRNVDYILTSCDYLDFMPIKIQ